ncbi:MAG: SdrD B-like domain-containing protein [Gallionella sp.]|nr:SdrD B-like domain-containing protein [Gallionella sp.]
MSASNNSTLIKRLANTVRCAGRTLLAALLFFASFAQAIPMVGTLITNQASANYIDSVTSLSARLTSNIVEVQVQQVSSFTLTAPQSRVVTTPGGTYYLPHQIRNTGNGADSFNLSVAVAGGTLGLSNVVIYADANADGIPDNLIPLVNTGSVAAGSAFNVVISATVGVLAVSGASGQVVISASATATTTPAPSQSNTDTLVLSNQAVLSVTKSFSVISGPSPNTNGAAHISVTLSFVNNGNATASAIKFSDVIGAGNIAPAYNTTGMSYVAGSGSWNGALLTDAAGADPAGISYSATTVAGVTTLSGTLVSLAAGAATQVTFLVDVLPGLVSGSAQTNNIVRVSYSDGLAAQTTDSNAASYTVQGGAGALSPDLILKKTHTGNFTVGLPGTFNLLVSNIGGAATTGMVTVSDTLPAGLTYVPATSGGNGWTCNAAAQVITCSSAAVIAAGANALNLPITVTPTTAAQAASPLTNTAQVAGGGELALNSTNNAASDIVIVGLAATVSGRVWLDANHNRRYDAGETFVSGMQVELLNSAGVVVATAITNANGSYTIGPIAPGTGYRLRFRDLASGALFASPVNGEYGVQTSSATVNSTTGEIQNLNLVAGNNIVEQSLPLDPSGVVYDSITRVAVAGAKVTFTGPAGFNPAIHLLGGTANAAQTVGVNGYYQFLLLGAAPAGLYKLQVTAPAKYTAPSVLIPTQPVALSPPTGVGQYPVQTQAGAPQVGSPTTYYLSINLAAGLKDVVNNHIPIDPVLVAGSGLLASKVASRTTAEPGDFVDYTIVVKNTTTLTLPSTRIQDILPRGFRYVPGTTRLNNIVQADPAGGVGPVLTFALGNLSANTSVTLTYRAAIGIEAALGSGINRAQASSGAAMSNVATAAVQIVQGVFSDKGYILGTVYLDCNRNHVQETDEPGIPGIRLFLEDGTNVTSDSDGKYSLYGIVARTHTLKLDDSTLPAGAVLEVLANRNAGVAGSRFVDLKNGELHRADFASDTCTADVLQEIKLRHDKRQNNETERALSFKLNPQASVLPLTDNRALPAAGELGKPAGAINAAQSFQPVAQDAGLNSANSNLPDLPVATVPVVDMDTLLSETDNSFDFIDLKDHDIMPVAQANVRIKGMIGSIFSLSANDQVIGQERVGKKSTLADKQLEAWEYIGVLLKPGENQLTIRQMDQFGNERGIKRITLVAPDKMAHIVVEAPKTVEANGRTPFTVKISLVDESGVVVTSRTYLTLEANPGRWQTKDLNPKEPGVQVFMEGGRAEFSVLPPALPGEDVLRVSSGIIKAEHRIAYLPELRPLVAAGLIEGAFNMHSLKASQLVPVGVNDSFEQEIKRIAATDGRNSLSERAALFLKGKVKGEYLLTVAYDSDKSAKQRLFRDIQPDEFYPVYGDSSIKGYDAQSTSRLYVRVDKGKSYLLYGDYVTQSINPARSLSQYNRTLTGVKEHYENDHVMVNAFASQDTSRQVIQEIPANGTSGPYQLNNNGALINSEKIEILTRDRSQPALILKAEQQSRFVDYQIEQYTGRILFKAPVPSLDANLNPKSIRITFEMDQGGKSFWVSGVDGQLKLTEQLEVGAVLAHDSNPLQPVKLSGANASLKLTEKSVLTGEVAHTSTIIGTGNAQRLELRLDDGGFQGRIYTGRSDLAFDNTASILSRGRRESGARGTFKLDATTTLGGEMIDSGDLLSGSSRKGVLLKLEKGISDTVRVEVGARDTRETSTQAGIAASHITSLRLKTTAQISRLAGLSVNGEYEQDIRDSGKKVAAIGVEYQMMNRGRIYARHEFISSLTSPFALNATQRSNTTVFGMDTDYTPDTHLFSEYRARGAIDGAQAEAAVGLRNKWQLDEGLRLNTSAERVVNVAGGAGRSAQAYTGAVEYTADPLWKGSARLEYHNSDTASGWLNSLDAARKLSNSWTVIGKHVFAENASRGAAAGVRIQQRLQGGLAWRDLDAHEWNVLSKLEHRRESDTTAAASVNRRVDIVSAHANYQPESNWQASAHYAAKWVTDHSMGLSSSSNTQLVAGRLMWDVTERWDAGVNASVMGDRNFRSMRYGMGAEVGYLVQENLWVSAGYNFFGFKEPDMVGQNATDKGFLMRLRFKFDEDMFNDILSKFDEKAKP